MNDLPSSDQPPLVPTSEATAVCAVSGKTYPQRAMIQYDGKWIAAEHKDAFFQRMREGVPERQTVKYAGFWIRVVARLIDLAILWAVNLGVTFGLSAVILGQGHWMNRPAPGTTTLPGGFGFLAVNSLVNMIVALAYACFFIRKFDATPGKLALGLKILRPDGNKLGVGRIIGRYFSELVSAMILFFGYFMVGWDDQKRALHDRICDTRVIRAR